MTSKKYIFAIFGIALAASSILAAPMSAQAATLFVDLDANPNVGTAPLHGVDVSATVTGTATGPITYKFDCTNNGTWEHEITTNNADYTAFDLCNYTNPGTYQVKAFVTRGGLAFTGTATVVVDQAQQKTLFVDISADPNTGFAPLNGVDLTAAVSGTAEGAITYKFDCTNNGTWERTITTNNTAHTAVDLCNYADPGDYLAKVFVSRDGLTFSGTASIAVDAVPAPSLSISKTAGVEVANPGGTVPYTIVIQNTGNVEARNIVVTDQLPGQLVHPDINSTTKQWTFTTIQAGESKTIDFNVKVQEDAPEGFATNTATVDADKINPVSDSATIEIRGGVLGEEGEPVLEIVKTANKEFVKQGETVSYTIKVTNTGEAPAVNVTITDVLPADFATESGETTVVFNVSSLAEGDFVEKSFIAQVSNTAALGDHTNVARATADNFTPTVEAFHTITVQQKDELPDTGISSTALMLWGTAITLFGLGGYELYRRKRLSLLRSKI